MPAAAKLQPTTKTSDMRSWAQRAEELLMEVREHIKAEKPTLSNETVCQKIDHFLLTGEHNPNLQH